MPVLNPTHLRTLGAVLASGSIAEAAARLGYTPSAVSQQIAALERASGLTLFERAGRSLAATQAAQALAERAAPILHALDALDREVRALAVHERGVVRLGSFPTASAELVPDALARLRRARPQLEVLLDQGEPDELVPLFDAGGLDIALVYEYEAAPRRWPDDLMAVPLLAEELFLLVPRSDAGLARRARLGDLRDASWIATREGTGGERTLRQLCARAGFSPRIDHRSNDFGVVRGLVRAGLGVAVVPALALVPDPDVQIVPLDHGGLSRTVLALSRPGRADGLAAAVVASLQETVRRCADERTGWSALGRRAAAS